MMGVSNQVRATLDEILRFRSHSLTRKGVFPDDFIYLRGAQEEMWDKLQQIQFAGDAVSIVTWMLQRGLGATLECYGSNETEALTFARQGVVEMSSWTSRLRASMRAIPGHIQLHASLRRAALDSDGRLLFVNAGIDPNFTLGGQTDAFWWNSSDIKTLSEPYQGFQRIFTGYSETHGGIEVYPFATSLDAGAGFGGPLMIACITQDGEFAEVYQA